MHLPASRQGMENTGFDEIYARKSVENVQCLTGIIILKCIIKNIQSLSEQLFVLCQRGVMQNTHFMPLGFGSSVDIRLNHS